MLDSLLVEQEDIYLNDINKLYRLVDIFLRKGKIKIKGGLNDKNFEQLMLLFIETFRNFKICKAYNSTMIPKLNQKISTQIMDLVGQLSTINTTPLTINGNGGTCFDWALLILNIFSEINPEEDIKKMIVQYEGSIHVVVLISYNGIYYQIDPFRKMGEYILKLEVGTRIYLGERQSEEQYAEVESILPLSFSFRGENINYKTLTGDELINTITPQTFVGTIKVKVYLNDEICNLDIDIHSKKSNSYTVEFDGVETFGDITVLKNLVKDASSSFVIIAAIRVT